MSYELLLLVIHPEVLNDYPLPITYYLLPIT